MPGDARRYRVDPHPVFGGFDCAATRQSHHSGLGRCIVRLRMLGPPPEHAGVVDDDAAMPGFAKVPQSRPGGPHHRGQADVENAVPFLIGHVDHRRLSTQSGVVDEHVEPTEAVDRRRDQRIDLRGGRDIADHPRHPAQAEVSQFDRGLGEPTFVMIGDDDVGPFEQRPTGSGRSDPGTGGRGHHHHFAGQQSVPGDLMRNLDQTHPLASLGRPSTRSAMMLRWISFDPP